MQQIAIAVLVVVMMFAIGLRSAPAEFREVARHPGRMAWSMLTNIVVVPFVALVVCRELALPPAVFLGLMLCAVSPGGATGPLFASIAGGHLATAVSAMVGLSLIAVFSAPLTISLALDASITIESRRLLLPMMGTLFLFQLVPLVLGMTVRWRLPGQAARWSGPFSRLANVLLLLVIVGLLIAKGHLLLALGGAGLALCLGLALGNVALGSVVAGPPEVRRSLALVAGVRNISLSLLLSAAYFPEPLTDVAVLAFGLFTMVVPGLVAALWARQARDRHHPVQRGES